MMKRNIVKVSLAMVLVAGVARAAGAGFPTFPVRKCGVDAVPAGTVCLDRYEASVWRIPFPTTTNAFLVRKVQQGRATEADLTAGGATQLGTKGDDYARCTDNGQSCADIYAVSFEHVTSGRVTHVTSLRELLAFLGDVLRQPRAGA